MLLLSLASLALAAATSAQDIVIDHAPVACVLADAFPRLSACFGARAELGAPRVYFRGRGDARWYFVEMQRDGACFTGVLPKPTSGLASLDYYIAAQAVTPPFAQGQSRVFSPAVKAAAQGCATPFLREAKVRAMPTEGDLSVPVGFAREGLQGLPQPARRVGGGMLVIGAGVAAATTLAAGTAIVAASEDKTPTAAPPATSAPTPAVEPAERAPTSPPPASPTPAPTVPEPTTPVPTTAPPPPPTTLPIPPTTLPPITLPLAPITRRGDEAAGAARLFAGVSSLEAPGARGQIVLNGREAWMPAAGTAGLSGRGLAGRNQLELHVVQAGGEGTWRVELLAGTRLREGSWRVISGDVVRIEDRAVVLRVRGRDQRAVLSFELD